MSFSSITVDDNLELTSCI